MAKEQTSSALVAVLLKRKWTDTMIVTASPDIDILARGLILGPLGLFWMVMTARVIGLRTFSKMTVFDFITTVAVGSLLANVATATS